MIDDKKLRRVRKTRALIKRLSFPRLTVYRTPNHIYAQVILPDGSVAVSASTLDGEVRNVVSYGGNISAATVVGKFVALRAKGAGITKVAFDRSGFKYHGRVKSLAEAAREHGLVF